MSKRKILVDCLYDQHMLLDRELFDVEEINSKAAIFTPIPEKNTYYMFHNVGWQETGVFIDNIFLGSPNFINCSRERDLAIKARCNKHGIKSPDLYYAKDLFHILSKLDASKKYILRYFGHARSLGMLVFKRENLYKILTDAIKLTNSDFNSVHNVSLGNLKSMDERKELQKAILSSNAYISEMIEFDTEYRILMFLGKDNGPTFMIESRSGYGPNSEKKREHKCISEEILASLVGQKMVDEIIQKLYKILLEMNVPALSFDVYIDGKNWGLFEYSTQFGVDYQYFYDDLIGMYSDAMTIICNKLDNEMGSLILSNREK